MRVEMRQAKKKKKKEIYIRDLSPGRDITRKRGKVELGTREVCAGG